MTRGIREVVVAMATLGLCWCAVGAQHTPAPSTRPAMDFGRVEVSPAAGAVLERMADAFSGIKSLEVRGTQSTELTDTFGRKHVGTTPFLGYYRAPDKCWIAYGLGSREPQPPVDISSLYALFVWNGEWTYIHIPPMNRYAKMKMPAGRIPRLSPYDVVPHVLGRCPLDDPNIVVTAIPDGVRAYIERARPQTIEKLADLARGGRTYSVIRMAAGPSWQTTWTIDPQTHLLRAEEHRMRIPMGPPSDWVRTTEYSSVRPGATIDESIFAWKPPAGADRVPADPDPSRRQDDE